MYKHQTLFQELRKCQWGHQEIRKYCHQAVGKNMILLSLADLFENQCRLKEVPGWRKLPSRANPSGKRWDSSHLGRVGCRSIYTKICSSKMKCLILPIATTISVKKFLFQPGSTWRGPSVGHWFWDLAFCCRTGSIKYNWRTHAHWSHWFSTSWKLSILIIFK